MTKRTCAGLDAPEVEMARKLPKIRLEEKDLYSIRFPSVMEKVTLEKKKLTGKGVTLNVILDEETQTILVHVKRLNVVDPNEEVVTTE